MKRVTSVHCFFVIAKNRAAFATSERFTGLETNTAKIAKGSGEPERVKVGEISKKQVEEIAKIKFEDLNAYDLKSAIKIIEGTARSMGITVTQ